MDKIYEGCFVKCIMKSSYAHAPETIVGKIYTVVGYRENGWVRLKGTDPPRDSFKFAIKRFEFYQNDGKMYPTINEKYFKE